MAVQVCREAASCDVAWRGGRGLAVGVALEGRGYMLVSRLGVGTGRVSAILVLWKWGVTQPRTRSSAGSLLRAVTSVFPHMRTHALWTVVA